MDWLNVCTLLGGLGLFLFGIKMMGEGLERAGGRGIQRLLGTWTGSRFMAMLAGLGITAVIQSSGTTTVMVVGFVNAGLLSLGQAVGVIMGANIGATVTSLLLSLPLNLGYVFAAVGILVILAGRRDRVRRAGNILMGLGILFIGMNTMSQSLDTLNNIEAVRLLFSGISNPYFGVLAGIALAALLQSGTAAIGLLQLLAFQGLIPLTGAIFLLIGMNIGSCITALTVSAGSSHTAKRAAVVHLLFNVIGACIFMVLALLLPLPGFFASLAPGSVRLQIALFHVAFNLGAALVLLPLARVLEKLAWLLVRGVDEQREDTRLANFDPRLLATPSVAMSQLFKEVMRMGELAKRNFMTAMRCFLEEDLSAARQVQDTEDVLDFLNQEVATYLVEVRALDLGEKDVHIAGSLFHVINDLERIGDHSINILEAAQKRVSEQIKFSMRAGQELNDLYARVAHMVDQALHIFADRITDPDILAGIENEEQAVDDLTAALRNHHVERLKNRKCSARSGMLYLDMLIDLERVADHANNIAAAVNPPHGDSVWIQ
jgi:phosphate:Na+ symporter